MWKWRLLIWLLRRFARNERRLQHWLLSLQTSVQDELNRVGEVWQSYATRLRLPPPPPAALTSAARVGIVIQGKLITEQDFTRRTIAYYRAAFPQCPIFVSTWENEDSRALADLQAAGATVLCSPLPEFPGPNHLNYQIRSTQVGIAAAREAGCEWVLKTRTDTRINASRSVDFLVGLHGSFPVAGRSPQRGRIVVLDLATRLYIPHHPADILMFGYTEDLARYWETPPFTSQKGPEREDCSNFGDLVASIIPEVYLCRSYLDRIGYLYSPSITDWWRCLSELFLVVDRTALDHFWPKYDYAREHHPTPDFDTGNIALCSFRDWLAITHFEKQPQLDLADLQPQRVNARLPRAA